MQGQFRLPLIFFFAASCIGLLLRWTFIIPLDWFQFSNWLHAHSHIMFLGWVFNTLFLAYLGNYSLYNKKYKILFIIIQIVLGGMLISFPLQGYGVISIVLSSLHTIFVFVFCWWIFADFKKLQFSTSIWFAKVSLILFLLSVLGPLTLGPLVANGFGQTKWYYFSVYYYLHFQYNGVFIFGILSLFFHVLENRGLNFHKPVARRSGLLLLIALFPTYFLSTLWTNPGLIFNLIGFTGALIQFVALYFFVLSIRKTPFPNVNRAVKTLLMMAFFAFILKLFLQLISAQPQIAQLALQVRPLMISYLHLVTIGLISFFLIAWYLERGIVSLKFAYSIKLIIIGFVGSELTLVLSGIPFTSKLLIIQSSVLLFTFSLILVVGIGIFLRCSYLRSIGFKVANRAFYKENRKVS